MIFFVVLLLVLIGMIPISKMIYGKIFNPISAINTIFSLWLILGRIGLFNQLIPTYESSIFIETNIIVIDLFIFAARYLLRKNTVEKEKPKKIRKIDSELIFKYLRIICLIISLAIFVNLIIKIATNSISTSAVRDISYSTRYGDDYYKKIYFNGIIYYLYQYIIRGFVFFDITYNFSRLIYANKKMPLISITNFILFVLIMQSRIEILKFAILLIIIFFYFGIKLNKKQKKYLKRSLFIVIIVAMATFSIRTITKEDNFVYNSVKSLIVDYSGSNYTFSEYLKEHNDGLSLEDSPLIIKYLGGAGLALEHLARPFGFQANHTQTNAYLIKSHDIGSSDHYNAFYTMYFDFLNAGGYAGCYLFSIFLGSAIGLAYERQRRNPSLKRTYASAFLTYAGIMGTYNYVLSSISALTIITCIILSKDMVIDKRPKLDEENAK